jgi:hypothetical protein
MTENPRVLGADYSVYVRIVRLCLIEKGVEYELLPIDVFANFETPLQAFDLRAGVDQFLPERRDLGLVGGYLDAVSSGAGGLGRGGRGWRRRGFAHGFRRWNVRFRRRLGLLGAPPPHDVGRAIVRTALECGDGTATVT